MNQFRISGSIVLITIGSLCAEVDWSRFRGPNGSAISNEKGFPTTWSDEKGVVWKTKLPGPGSSSPIAVGGHVFLTCYSGYGEVSPDMESGDPEDLKRHLICIDRKTGRILWNESVRPKLPEAPFRPPGTSNHGYSSSTPVSDGEQVYFFLGKTGVFAFDLKGKELW